MKFGEHLMSQKIIGSAELDEAIGVQSTQPMKIGRILRDLGYLDQGDLNRQLCLFLTPKELKSVDEYHKMKSADIINVN